MIRHALAGAVAAAALALAPFPAAHAYQATGSNDAHELPDWTKRRVDYQTGQAPSPVRPGDSNG